MKRPFRQDGFTMIELIVYLGIASVALLVFFGFAANVLQSAARAKSASDAQGNARVVMSRITHDIRTADTAAVLGTALNLTTVAGGVSTTTCYDRDAGIVKYGTCTGVGCPCAVSESLSDGTVNVTALSFDDLTAPQIDVSAMIEPRNGTADAVTASTTVVRRSALYQSP